MRFAFCGALTGMFVWSCLAMAEQPNADPFPVTPNKKGLQVQMIEDAVALGVQHAALNVDLTRLIDPTGKEGGPTWEVNGHRFAFSPGQVAGIDARVKPLSDRNIVVTLILLTYVSGDADRDRLMLHPDYASGDPTTGPIGMFQMTTDEGKEALQACIEFLANRYSSDSGHGRVWGYICGNEVNSHWFWANMGPAEPEAVIDQYEKAVRIIHQAVRKFSEHARVYISMDHCWNLRYAAGSPQQCMAGREFLDRFAAAARQQGDYDWHVAYHPYPEPLPNPRFWLDTRHSLHHAETPVITFRNLQVLTDYLQREPLQWEGQPRRVILSEQGFHCDLSRPDGELEQAAAYALAYKKVDRLSGIDAFMLHRHTDHAEEGGLNLGLWTNKPGHICTPDLKRKMYEVFQAAGTAGEDEAFQFALPVIGAENWEEALGNLMQPQK
ncbi:DUF5722 domain-containing protein [Bremerella sp. JC817]|uniref:DUF5722 domain-containing protein n=1 Tax=Bremerella sp. JC817 TaxID=3231756 RepID=UPI00345AF66B